MKSQTNGTLSSIEKKWKWLVNDIDDPYKKSLVAGIAENITKNATIWLDVSIYSDVLWRKDFEFK